ncbi:hypothetical protein OG730_11855 [Streptomyces sp. NBC_01298]|uniref:hypothetical protein n=1 Tax=Streptomyces sp. NBC_01298 TaxID=2903817 RepID=UPI002E13CC52|nr:hypothetical protein OG730_11855 [Streptomyces sp. NBC_01298]
MTVELGVATREPSGPGQEVPYAWLKAETLGTGQGWRTTRVPLSELAGTTAHALAVRITRRGKEPVRWRLGAVTVREAAARPRPATPGTPAVSASAQQSGKAAVRLARQRSAGPVRHYEVSRVLPDGARRLRPRPHHPRLDGSPLMHDGLAARSAGAPAVHSGPAAGSVRGTASVTRSPCGGFFS